MFCSAAGALHHHAGLVLHVVWNLTTARLPGLLLRLQENSKWLTGLQYNWLQENSKCLTGLQCNWLQENSKWLTGLQCNWLQENSKWLTGLQCNDGLFKVYYIPWRHLRFSTMQDLTFVEDGIFSVMLLDCAMSVVQTLAPSRVFFLAKHEIC